LPQPHHVDLVSVHCAVAGCHRHASFGDPSAAPEAAVTGTQGRRRVSLERFCGAHRLEERGLVGAILRRALVKGRGRGKRRRTHTHTHTHTKREREGEGERETERQRDRERQRERQRERVCDDSKNSQARKNSQANAGRSRGVETDGVRSEGARGQGRVEMRSERDGSEGAKGEWK
jgi:hypothetical protein